MPKIQINNLNVEQFAALTENEAASIQGGFKDNGLNAAGFLVVAIGGAALASPAIIVAGGVAAIAVAGIAIYEAVR